MKTGMIRKIDELGRIVIPMEMRKSVGVGTDSEVEFYINKAGDICLAPVRSEDDLLRMKAELEANGYVVTKV